MVAERYWFADIDESQDGPWRWRPYLGDGGCVSSLDLWFETEDACLEYIAKIPAGTCVSNPPESGSTLLRYDGTGSRRTIDNL